MALYLLGRVMVGPSIFELYGNLNHRLIGRGVTGTIIELKRNSRGAPALAVVELDNGYKNPLSGGGWEFLPYELEEISSDHQTVMNSSYTPEAIDQIEPIRVSAEQTAPGPPPFQYVEYDAAQYWDLSAQGSPLQGV